MSRKPGVLVVIAIVAVFLPLMRFFNSPSFEVMRAVDMVLLFGAGMATGVLLVALGVIRQRQQ
jgi:hypothetical protein